MADSKITALTSISTSTDPAVDPLVIVDVSDTSMAATGTTKKVTLNNLLSSSPTATGALTVTGLVTAGSATITGAATVGTTLGVTGVSTLTGNAFANGSYTVVGGTPGAFANAALTINNRSNTGDLSLIALGYRPNGTVLNGSAYMGYIITNNSGNGLGDLIFGTRNVTTDTAPTERLRVTAAGNVNITTGNVVMSTSGAGIDFSATANSSGTMTSELLNDYEEGTWTGTLTGATTNPTVPVTATGRYTKIGRQVYVTINFNLVTTTGASGGVGITGLPFANNASNTAQGSILTDSTITFTGSPFAFLEVSATTLFIYQNISNGSVGFANHNVGINRYMQATITYSV